MEIKTHKSNRLEKMLWKEPKPFSSKRDFNFGFILKASGVALGITILILLVMPNPTSENLTYNERLEKKSEDTPAMEAAPSEDAWKQIQAAHVSGNSAAAKGFDLFGSPGAQGASGNRNLNTSMIISRGGLDSKTQLPPGTRFSFKLLEKSVVANQNMPIMAVMIEDVIHESNIAIPKESKLLGEVSFNESSERANISWNTVIFPDGRQKEISALGIGDDGQVGIKGNVYSDALQNTVGHTLTRFIGTYAEGSMTRNQNGFSEGGKDNGFKNAIAETAKDRAEALADGLKKTRKWIELDGGSYSQAVLSSPFTFRDPGSVH